MNKKSFDFKLLNFEHEQSPERVASPERRSEKEPGNEESEEQRIATVRQRNALAETQQKISTKCSIWYRRRR